jgi:hypothetical protein
VKKRPHGKDERRLKDDIKMYVRGQCVTTWITLNLLRMKCNCYHL